MTILKTSTFIIAPTNCHVDHFFNGLGIEIIHLTTSAAPIITVPRAPKYPGHATGVSKTINVMQKEAGTDVPLGPPVPIPPMILRTIHVILIKIAQNARFPLLSAITAPLIINAMPLEVFMDVHMVSTVIQMIVAGGKIQNTYLSGSLIILASFL